MRSVPGFVSDRVRQAREVRGVSVAALAERVGVTAQAAHRWEAGGSPRPELIPQIAQTLAVPPTFFFAEPPEVDEAAATFFRSRVSATKAARRGATARLQWCGEIVTKLANEWVELPEVRLPRFTLTDPLKASDEEIEIAAEETRRFFGIGDGPIANVVTVLEAHGVVVFKTPLGEGRLDAFSTWSDKGRPYVMLNADKKSAVRSRFDAAHELGHLVLHCACVPPNFLDDKDMFEAVERQADRFASAFLLPRRSAGRELAMRARSLDAMLMLKPRWGASLQSLLHRAHDLGHIEDATYKWMWVLLSRRGWRTSEPYDDMLAPEWPALLREVFTTLRRAGIRPEHEMVIPKPDIERLCGLPPGFLDDDTTSPPRVVLKQREATTHGT